MNDDDNNSGETEARLRVLPDREVVVRGALHIWRPGANAPIETGEAHFCRCGRCESDPFSDLSGGGCAIDDPGAFTNGYLETSEPRAPEGVLTVKPLARGPLLIEGAVVIEDANGEERHSPGRVLLCRCGRSLTKPFCDGRHRQAMPTPTPKSDDG